MVPWCSYSCLRGSLVGRWTVNQTSQKRAVCSRLVAVHLRGGSRVISKFTVWAGMGSKSQRRGRIDGALRLETCQTELAVLFVWLGCEMNAYNAA